MIIRSTLFAIICTLILGCNSSDPVNDSIDYKVKNEQDITAYINAKDLDAQRTDSGLYYVITTLGSGEQPTSNSEVTVAYKGYFLNGSVFDESTASGITINLNQVIKGWTEGITYFKEGGSGLLLVPAHLGYGNRNYNGIPGGSVLIFEIELLSVN